MVPHAWSRVAIECSHRAATYVRGDRGMADCSLRLREAVSRAQTTVSLLFIVAHAGRPIVNSKLKILLSALSNHPCIYVSAFISNYYKL
jgi:hypothetical protein